MRPSDGSVPLPESEVDASTGLGRGDDRARAGVLIRRWCRVTTRSGSIYDIVETSDGEYGLRVDNVPNPLSRSITPDRWWRIDTPEPWPPQVGLNLLLPAHRTLRLDDPERIPGGGMITSPVQDLTDASPMQDEPGLSLP
jgi:hypothetical protein